MAKFYVDLDIDLRAEVEIEAESLEEAMQKARDEQYELSDLNDGTVYDTRPVFIMDTNYNKLEEF